MQSIADRKPLAVNSANGDAPIIWIDASQLWNVTRNLAISVAFALPVDFLDVLSEAQKIGYDELMTKSASYENNVGFDDTGNKNIILALKGAEPGKTLRLECFSVKILRLWCAAFIVVRLMNFS